MLVPLVLLGRWYVGGPLSRWGAGADEPRGRWGRWCRRTEVSLGRWSAGELMESLEQMGPVSDLAAKLVQASRWTREAVGWRDLMQILEIKENS